MIQITFNVICDNCNKQKEYKKDNKENFMIDFCKDGWFIENNKHFCSERCIGEYNGTFKNL